MSSRYLLYFFFFFFDYSLKYLIPCHWSTLGYRVRVEGVLPLLVRRPSLYRSYTGSASMKEGKLSFIFLSLFVQCALVFLHLSYVHEISHSVPRENCPFPYFFLSPVSSRRLTVSVLCSVFRDVLGVNLGLSLFVKHLSL